MAFVGYKTLLSSSLCDWQGVMVAGNIKLQHNSHLLCQLGKSAPNLNLVITFNGRMIQDDTYNVRILIEY